MKNKIKEGTPCFISRIGHNGFWYPIYEVQGMTEFTEEVLDVKIKSWICGRKDMVAVEVLASKIKNLYGNPAATTIVWVERKNIESRSISNLLSDKQTT